MIIQVHPWRSIMSPLSAKLCRAVLLPIAAIALIAGCAKKPAATTEPPPTPPVASTPTPPAPPPVTTPHETAPAPPAVRSEDLMPAFFDYDSYTLRDDARAALDKNAHLLRDNPLVTVTIEGHCDERGTSEYNQALGERRAQAARDYWSPPASRPDASR
jgi:peptidoglycan-associated lipoprotein